MEILIFGDEMCEFCIKFEECVCECDENKLTFRNSSEYCEKCRHFINIGRLRYNKYHKVEGEEDEW